MVKGEYPGARDGHAMCVANGNIYVFGGYEEEVRTVRCAPCGGVTRVFFYQGKFS